MKENFGIYQPGPHFPCMCVCVCVRVTILEVAPALKEADAAEKPVLGFLGANVHLQSDVSLMMSLCTGMKILTIQ